MLSGNPAATGRGVNAAARCTMKIRTESCKSRHLVRIAPALGIVAVNTLIYVPAILRGVSG